MTSSSWRRVADCELSLVECRRRGGRGMYFGQVRAGGGVTESGGGGKGGDGVGIVIVVLGAVAAQEQS